MNIITSFCIAIAMYSRIPMVKMEWSKEKMKYSLAFFPFVGVIIGCIQILWFLIARKLVLTEVFYAAIATVIPVLITGGIHLDGYCDTVDALASYQPVEKRLEILKDSNAGAFAIIWTAVYFVVYLGACSELVTLQEVMFVSLGYVVSRALSALAAIHFKSANKAGTLAAFTSVSSKKIVRFVLVVVLISCYIGWCIINVITAVVMVAATGILFSAYYKRSKKEFGGITGDLAGWFTVRCELMIVVIAAVLPSMMK